MTATVALPADAPAPPGAAPVLQSEWTPLAALHDQFSGKMAAARWAGDLPESLRARDGQRWLVHADARLPGGLSVLAVVRGCAAAPRLGQRRLPPGHESWGSADRQRFLDTHFLLDRWSAFRRDREDSLRSVDREDSLRPADREDSLRSGARAHAQAFASAAVAEPGRPVCSVADWCAARGLSCTYDALCQYARRVAPTSLRFDGNVDRRGRPGSAAQIDAELFARFVSQVHAGTGISLRLAWRDTRDFAALAQHPGRPAPRWPSYASVRREYQRRFPQPVQVYGRRGEREYVNTCQPVIRRALEDVAPFDCWSLDGRTLDSFVRVEAPASRCGWKAERPTLTAIMDVGSRSLVGWDLTPTEHSDAILRGLKMAFREVGIPEELYLDNGRAYAKAVGSHFRKRSRQPDPRIHGLCSFLRCKLTNAIPGNARAKLIESNWRVWKDELDRLDPSFWGGSAAERGQDAPAEVKQIMGLPTLAERRALLGEFVAAWNHREHHGRGMDGLTPAQKLASVERVTRADDDVLTFLCSRIAAERVVTRDGVRLGGETYGATDDDVAMLVGRKVLVRSDPERRDFVWLCDPASGAPLACATNRVNRGQTQDELRAAQARKGRLKKLVASMAGARDFLQQNTAGQIVQMRREAAAIRQAAAPAAAAPQVTIVRPDLVTPVQRAREGLKRLGSAGAAPAVSPERQRAALRYAELGCELLPDAPPAARHSYNTDGGADFPPAEDATPRHRYSQIGGVA